MYKNAGKSIKSIVKFLVGVQIVLYVIIGLVLMFTNGAVGFFAGILVAGIGIFLAWVSGLVLYAFGEIADTLLCIKHKLGAEGIDEQESVLNTASTTIEQNGAEKVRKEMNQKPWVCYSCGTENRGSVSYCIKCGTNKAWSEGKQNNQ